MTLKVRVSNGLGIKTAAMLTSMDYPIGKHIGNALEVKESVECLQGLGPSDLEELVVAQGKTMFLYVIKFSN